MAVKQPAKVSMAETRFTYKPKIGVDDLNGTPEERQSRIQVIGENLEHIEQKHGSIKPFMVVDAARPPKSPLHKFFEWDDSKAAERHRLNQARQLISTVYVKSYNGHEAPQPVRAFVNVLKSDTNDRQYESITSVMSDDQKRNRLLAEAKRDLERMTKKYAALEELSEVFSAVSKVFS